MPLIDVCMENVWACWNIFEEYLWMVTHILTLLIDSREIVCGCMRVVESIIVKISQNCELYDYHIHLVQHHVTSSRIQNSFLISSKSHNSYLIQSSVTRLFSPAVEILVVWLCTARTDYQKLGKSVMNLIMCHPDHVKYILCAKCRSRMSGWMDTFLHGLLIDCRLDLLTSQNICEWSCMFSCSISSIGKWHLLYFWSWCK